jgi:hypothetical protein
VFGIPRAGTEGSRRLIQQSPQAGAGVIMAKVFTQAERGAKRRINKRLKLAQHLHHGYHGPWWSVRTLAILGTMPDAELAELLDRSVNAVRQIRQKRGIPNSADRCRQH